MRIFEKHHQFSLHFPLFAHKFTLIRLIEDWSAQRKLKITTEKKRDDDDHRSVADVGKLNSTRSCFARGSTRKKTAAVGKVRANFWTFPL